MMVARGGREGEDGVKKVKGSRNANWQLQSSHGDVKCSIGSTGNNTVITVCGGPLGTGKNRGIPL